IDVTRCFLAVAYCHCHRPFAWHHVAAGKYAWMAGHHVRRNDDSAISLELNFRNLAEKATVGVLSEGQDDRICLQGLELPGRLRSPLGINVHHFDGEVAAFDRLDACQPLDLDTLGQCLICLEGMCRHMSTIAAVYDECFFGAQTSHGAC